MALAEKRKEFSMDENEWALMAAGGIGTMVALVHGILIQKNMVLPLYRDKAYPERTRRLIAILLQFSTFCWLLGGIGLLAAPYLLDASSTFTLAVIVAGFYTFGAVGNFWGTRGRHPGWVLLAISVGLIAYGLFST
jgi:hypothetical protein